MKALKILFLFFDVLLVTEISSAKGGSCGGHGCGHGAAVAGHSRDPFENLKGKMQGYIIYSKDTL